MFLLALIAALLCTIGMCLVGLLIKWVVLQVGTAIFSMILIAFTLLFILVGGDE